MGHPTTKKIKLGEFDHANRISILRKEYGGFFRNGRAWAHRRGGGSSTVDGNVQENYFLREVDFSGKDQSLTVAFCCNIEVGRKSVDEIESIKPMDLVAEKIRLASLRQDFEILRQTLGVSILRRAIAELLDAGLAIGIAMVLRDLGLSPWGALAYFLVRDFPPMYRSIGKVFAGIKIYAAESLTPPSSGQLVVRGFANFVIVIPLVILLSVFFVFTFSAIAVCGLIGFVSGGDSWILRGIGYDFKTGRTIVDRLAKTHLIEPRDLDALSRMADKIERLNATMCKEQQLSMRRDA